MNLTLDVMLKHWPRANAELLEGIAKASAAVFEKFKINSPRRVAHFMAQCSHECGAGTRLIENLTYTTPERLMQVWPKRFPNVAAARPYLRNPVMLARVVYNGRNGNVIGTDDGFVYRGRGLIQITGRSNYTALAKASGIPLISEPELAADNHRCLEVAAAYWASRPLNQAADADDVREVTRLINGGQIGIDDRTRWLKIWKAELGA